MRAQLDREVAGRGRPVPRLGEPGLRLLRVALALGHQRQRGQRVGLRVGEVQLAGAGERLLGPAPTLLVPVEVDRRAGRGWRRTTPGSASAAGSGSSLQRLRGRLVRLLGPVRAEQVQRQLVPGAGAPAGCPAPPGRPGRERPRRARPRGAAPRRWRAADAAPQPDRDRGRSRPARAASGTACHSWSACSRLRSASAGACSSAGLGRRPDRRGQRAGQVVALQAVVGELGRAGALDAVGRAASRTSRAAGPARPAAGRRRPPPAAARAGTRSGRRPRRPARGG